VDALLLQTTRASAEHEEGQLQDEIRRRAGAKKKERLKETREEKERDGALQTSKKVKSEHVFHRDGEVNGLRRRKKRGGRGSTKGGKGYHRARTGANAGDNAFKGYVCQE